jgi:hypothetical protein
MPGKYILAVVSCSTQGEGPLGARGHRALKEDTIGEMMRLSNERITVRAKEHQRMRFVDAHLHTDMIEDIQLQKLVMMGMEAAVIPSPHMFLGSHDADAVLLLWERFLTLEVNTAKTLGFEAYASLSVPFFGVTAKDAEKCLEKLPDFLKHERVVAMGERPGLRDAVRDRSLPRAPAHRQGSRSARDPAHAHPPGAAGTDDHPADPRDHH